MKTATLIAAEQHSGITRADISLVQIELGGGDVVWLAKGKACDITLPDPDRDWRPIWQKLQNRKIDLVVQPSSGRRKKILLADMDSTMINQECIDELAAEAGVGDRVAEITARAMNGEIDFENALRERVRLLAGLDVSVIQSVLQSRITLMPGGPVLLATMKAHGAYAALVSGGFTDFAQAICDRLGFDENRANTLLQKEGRLTGQPGIPILGSDAKVEALCEITARLGLRAKDVLAVGDGANDLAMLQLAGSGVAMHAKPLVAAQTDMRLNHADLTGLLYIQGYKSSEFLHPIP